MFALSAKTKDPVPLSDTVNILTVLPNELIEKIASFLPRNIPSLRRWEQTNKLFYTIAEPYWIELFLTEYPSLQLKRNHRSACLQLYHLLEINSRPREHNEVRIAVMGEGGVGKSALVIRFTHDQFVSKYDPTIEDSYRKHITIGDDQYLLDVLDTAGPEEYHVYIERQIRWCDGFVLCCALNDATTLHKLEEYLHYFMNVLQQEPIAMPLILSVNKSDLGLTGSQISMEDVQKFADEHGIRHVMKTSALAGTNVKELFDKICLMSAGNRQAAKVHCMEILKQNPDWIKKLEDGISIFEDDEPIRTVKQTKCSLM